MLPHRSHGSIYEMCHRLGLQKDPLWNALRRERETANLLTQGKKYRFRKGQVSHNKGIKGVYGVHPNTAKHWFKPGQVNGREFPIGSERMRDGYLERKVSDRKDIASRHNWKFVHRMVWEEHHGPIPKSHAVTFQNGDRSDIRIENLQLTSRVDLMKRNTVHNYPEDVRASVHASSRLSRVINHLKGKVCEREEKQPG